MTDESPAKSHSTGRWQASRRKASDLALELPETAEGTHAYIVTDGLRIETVMLLRAYVREATRAGRKVRLL